MFKRKMKKIHLIEFCIAASLFVFLIIFGFNAIFLIYTGREIASFSNEEYNVSIIMESEHRIFGNDTISVHLKKKESPRNAETYYLETTIPHSFDNTYSVNWIDGGAELEIDRGLFYSDSKYVLLWNDLNPESIP